MLLKSSIPTTDARPHSWYFVNPNVCTSAIVYVGAFFCFVFLVSTQNGTGC